MVFNKESDFEEALIRILQLMSLSGMKAIRDLSTHLLTKTEYLETLIFPLMGSAYQRVVIP